MDQHLHYKKGFAPREIWSFSVLSISPFKMDLCWLVVEMNIWGTYALWEKLSKRESGVESNLKLK